MNRHLSGMLLAVGLICGATGCNLALNRSVAGNGTIEALAATALYQTAVVQTQSAALQSLEAPPPTATATLQPTPTFTPTITLTPTLEKVTVTVSKNTNCRQGPDKFFDLVGIMKVGETAEAIGRNEQKTYWVIRLPSNTAKTCWLWYEWATLTGNGDALPVIQSPPTPTWSPKPDFTFYYVGVTTCGAQNYLRLQIVNTGNVPWESYRITIRNTVTSISASVNFNAFRDYNGCSATSTVLSIAPGAAANTFGVIPPTSSGQNLAVTLDLYTQDTGGGTHMAGDFNFAMP